MRPVTTRPRAEPTLYIAFELGNTEWKLALTTGIDQAPVVRTMTARALKTLEAEIARVKGHFGLPATALVRSCYEAGRDGFWLHRYLLSRGVYTSIVDSSSIEVNRRRRRTKTDRLDACKLVTMMIRADAGEKKVWSVIHVPTLAEEDRRQVHRELLFARRDRGRHANRIKGLLANQGSRWRGFGSCRRTCRPPGCGMAARSRRSCVVASSASGRRCSATRSASAPLRRSAAPC
jgi:transposase